MVSYLIPSAAGFAGLSMTIWLTADVEVIPYVPLKLTAVKEKTFAITPNCADALL